MSLMKEIPVENVFRSRVGLVCALCSFKNCYCYISNGEKREVFKCRVWRAYKCEWPAMGSQTLTATPSTNTINNTSSSNMFVKLAVLACVAVAAFGQHWGGNQGQWNGDNGGGGHWNGAQNALDAGQYTGDGDYHGEGLQEAGAFGDVSQNWHDGGNNGQWNGAQAGQWNGGDNGQWNGGHGGQWNGAQAGAWNGGAQAGAWNGGAQAGAWNGGAHAAPAALPAGVDAHACPNYPFCH